MNITGGAFGCRGEQRARMSHNQWIIVYIDDARLRRDRLGHLVSIVGSRQTSANVQKLANPYPYQVPNGTDQEPSFGADSVPQARDNRKNLFTKQFACFWTRDR